MLPIIDPYDANILSAEVATQYPPDANISFVKKYIFVFVSFLKLLKIFSNSTLALTVPPGELIFTNRTLTLIFFKPSKIDFTFCGLI